MQKPLTVIDDGSSSVQLYPDWAENAEEVFQQLRQQIAWQSRSVRLFGKASVIPRLESWQALPGVNYRYSGQTYLGKGWPKLLDRWAERLQQQFLWQANGVLLNYYRNGKDSMGWHADNEPELGQQPSVAIVSLGAARDLRFRKLSDPKQTLTVTLPQGSLLWMSAGCQQHWQHSIPKRANAYERISCTFRKIVI